MFESLWGVAATTRNNIAKAVPEVVKRASIRAAEGIGSGPPGASRSRDTAQRIPGRIKDSGQHSIQGPLELKGPLNDIISVPTAANSSQSTPSHKGRSRSDSCFSTHSNDSVSTAHSSGDSGYGSDSTRSSCSSSSGTRSRSVSCSSTASNGSTFADGSKKPRPIVPAKSAAVRDWVQSQSAEHGASDKIMAGSTQGLKGRKKDGNDIWLVTDDDLMNRRYAVSIISKGPCPSSKHVWVATESGGTNQRHCWNCRNDEDFRGTMRCQEDDD
ncbi:hypothetical protein BJ508DRAFT_142655 [Ascobolus immersus RN42]|uniref:Uncharacterized protein n=1 Tax=Ascobolus immersus RN42 TaxID=1160509 RepID=A0A3N4ICF0_ASCIM|nr:hypothetical protein BJ508DRAFT_142655 [Ascobolus immersus RN42]